MSLFDGRWKRVSATNVDALIKVAVTDDADKAARLKQFLELAPLEEEVKIDSSGVHRKIYVGGELKREQQSSFDVEQERDTFLGKSKIFGTRKGDNVIEVKEKAEGRPDACSVFTVNGNKLTVDYTMGGVTCTRNFEKC